MIAIAPAVRAAERLGSIEPLLAMPENECAHGYCDGDVFYYERPPCACREFIVVAGCKPRPAAPDLMSTLKAAKAVAEPTVRAKRAARPDELLTRVLRELDAEIERLKRARKALAKVK